jgi:hypothetical protein
LYGIGTSREGLNDEQLLGMGNYGAARRAVERQRVVPGKDQVDKQNLLEIVLQGDFITNKQGMRFLLWDSRAHEPEEPYFFIFATDIGLEWLSTYIQIGQH